MKKFSRITSVCALLLIGIAATPSPSAAAPPDPVLEWINIMNDTVLAGGTPPFFTSRIAAMVSASVFDAVNGIEPRYGPIYVPPNAPDGASPRAAAIEAAYVILADAYPMQASALTTQVKASLAALADRKCAIHIRRRRLGANRRQCHLGLETNGRFRAASCPF